MDKEFSRRTLAEDWGMDTKDIFCVGTDGTGSAKNISQDLSLPGVLFAQRILWPCSLGSALARLQFMNLFGVGRGSGPSITSG